MVHQLCEVASKGGNYLLNVGPDALGQLPTPATDLLLEVGKWLESNGEAVYQTKAGPPEKRNPNIGMVTTRPNTLYLHVTQWPEDGRIYYKNLREKSETRRKVIQEAYLLLNPVEKLVTMLHQDGLTIFLDTTQPDPINSVVVVKYE